MLNLLSQLAEIGFVGSLTMVALVTLTVRGHLRVALYWGVGMLLGLGAVLLLKRSMADDPVLSHFPSGHVALAVTFYGGLAVILWRDELASTAGRVLFYLATFGSIALAEGISRVVLTEHGWVDVVGGLVVGLCGLAVAGNPWAWEPIDRRDRLWLAGAVLAAAPAAWSIYPYINPWLRYIAGV